MATQYSKINVSPSLAHAFTTSAGTVAAHYNCPCGSCIAGPSTYTRSPGGKLPFRNGSLPPRVPYIEDIHHTITIIPPSGPYFLNDNESFFSDDSPVEQQRRGVLRSRVLHIRAIAYRAKASLDNIRKAARHSDGTASSDTRLPPMLRSGEIADGFFADRNARRGIQTAETQLAGLKRRMATKEKVKRWIHTSETEPRALKRRMSKEGAKRWIQTSETEPMALKRRMLTKKEVKGWFHNITGGGKVRRLGRKVKN